MYPTRDSVAPAAEAKGDPSQTLANKTTWLPPGAWYNGLTGEVHSVSAEEGVNHTRGYTLGEVPMWFKGGAVIPYLPLKSLPSLVGVAAQQYTYLGFRVLPGDIGTGSTYVYEDDGSSTAYLKGAHVWTSCNFSSSVVASISPSVPSTTITISSTTIPYSYDTFPKSRAYQLRLPNRGPPASVMLNGAPVPFSRWGAVHASRKTPPTSQWYYAFDEDEGIGPVIDLVGIDTGELTYLLTYLLTCLLTYLPRTTYLLTYLLTYLPTYLLTYLLVLIYLLTY